jgi:cystathionine beta-lyase
MDTLQKANKGILPSVNTLGYTAALAAYQDGRPWLEGLLAYLRENRDYLMDYLGTYMPRIDCKTPEGTFLAWLDCRDAGIPGNAHEFFLERARVALNDGAAFGKPGVGFVRLNFACPRELLIGALERMRGALDAL